MLFMLLGYCTTAINSLTSEYELVDVFKLTAIIEIHNTGHVRQNRANLTGWYTRVNWHRFAKNRQNDGRNTGG